MGLGGGSLEGSLCFWGSDQQLLNRCIHNSDWLLRGNVFLCEVGGVFREFLTLFSQPMSVSCLFSLSLNAALQNSRVRENVVVHEIGRAIGVRQDDAGRGLPGAEVEREVCLSSRVHYERVHRAAEAM